jgi:hypothetical protein
MVLFFILIFILYYFIFNFLSHKNLKIKKKAMSAVALWNNMFQKVGQKSTSFKVDQPISCPPKDHPYFYTNKN